MEQNGLCFPLLNGPQGKEHGLGEGESREGLLRKWFLMCGSTVKVDSAYKEHEKQAAEFRCDRLKNENP